MKHGSFSGVIHYITISIALVEENILCWCG